MKQQFQEHRFRAQSLEIIEEANRILSEYAAQGYDLTLRQLYYQFVARDILPDGWEDRSTGSKNNMQSYKKLGDIVSDARMAGLIDWDYIKDRARSVVALSHWESPRDILYSAAHSFRVDKWASQPNRVYVMVEKQALEGILIPVCREYDVPFLANKGYSSQSMFYEIGREMGAYIARGQEVHVIYLGDHDPSGIDMTRDVEERLCIFSEEDIIVHRLALNIDQVKQWNPPENPAKDTDSRYESYRSQFGEASWELDAVEPGNMVALVSEQIDDLLDQDLWDDTEEQEAEQRAKLKELASTWK